jgi:uncharacterized protein (DUF952 family)
MRYVIIIFTVVSAMAWDFTQNHGAYTSRTVRNVHHFIQSTL